MKLYRYIMNGPTEMRPAIWHRNSDAAIKGFPPYPFHLGPAYGYVGEVEIVDCSLWQWLTKKPTL